MRRTVQPSRWKQTLLLGLAFVVVGSVAALVLYGNAVSTVSEAARSRLLDTAHMVAVQIDVERHSNLASQADVSTNDYKELVSDLVKIVGTIGDVERLYTVRRTDDGMVVVLNASRSTPSTATEQTYLSSVKHLPASAGKSWSLGVTVLEEEPIKTNGETVLRAFVPLIANDRTVEALLVVELDYASVEASLAQLRQGLWLGLGGVFLVSGLFAWALTKSRPATGSWFSSGLVFHKNRRVWITVTLLLASAALVSDGAIGFYNLETAGTDARLASKALQASRELQNELQRERSQGWSARLNSLEEFYEDSGQPWIASQIADYKSAVAEGSPRVSVLGQKLIQAAQQDVARVQGDLSEAGGRIQVENSHQTFRLTMSVVLGLVAIILISVVSRQEKRLEAALDENTLVQQEYKSLVGNLPIGMFAYSNGEVLFSNRAWGRSNGDDPDTVLDAIHKDDRAVFDAALRQAEVDMEPFSTTLKIVGKFETTHYEASCAPVTDSDGLLRHLLIFCVDVTPLVSAKDEVQKKHREVEKKNRQLNAVFKQVEHSLHTTVETMIRAVEVKDPYTAGHSERVRQYCVWMGEHLSLSEYELKILSHGARIHDVGKIGIPDEILTKPSALTPDEFEVIKQHTVAGAKIVGNIEIFKDCVPIVRWHHERLDGSGYPDGLIGDEVPFLVRLVAVADMFDAMTSNRAYRNGMKTEDALRIISRDVADGKIDAIAFSALVDVIDQFGTVSQLDHCQKSKAA